MAQFTIAVNQEIHLVNAAPETPLLWILRDNLGLTGTKYGCGRGLCRACVIHINGVPKPSCQIPISTIREQKVTTIEGLSQNGDHAVQQAWVEEDVPQCGYCQAGQIMSAAALLEQNPQPSDEEIDVAMAGHLCRCGTYQRIRRGIHRAARRIKQE